MSGCQRRWTPSAPGGSPRLGAFPRSRRAWVLGRVIAITAAGMVLTSGLLAGLWLLHVGTGVVAAPTSIDAMNTLGLVLVAFLLAAAFVAAFDSQLALFLVPWLAVPLPPLLAGAAVVAATGDRFQTGEVLSVLFLMPAFQGQPHLGTALALVLWILVAPGALWVAAEVRPASDGR